MNDNPRINNALDIKITGTKIVLFIESLNEAKSRRNAKTIEIRIGIIPNVLKANNNTNRLKVRIKMKDNINLFFFFSFANKEFDIFPSLSSSPVSPPAYSAVKKSQ